MTKLKSFREAMASSGHKGQLSTMLEDAAVAKAGGFKLDLSDAIVEATVMCSAANGS